MAREEFLLLGHSSPLGRYPAPVVPVGRLDEKMVAVYAGEEESNVVPITEDCPYVIHDPALRRSLYGFDYRRQRLFALEEDRILSYSVEREREFFLTLLEDPQFSRDNPFLRLSLAKSSRKASAIARELSSCVYELSRRASHYLDDWIDEEKQSVITKVGVTDAAPLLELLDALRATSPDAESMPGRVDVASTLHQLGNLDYLQGEYGRAREHYEQSLAILQELGNRAGVAGALHQLGMLHQLQGEYEWARGHYKQSLEIAQELGDRVGVAVSLRNIGLLHQEQGEYAQAFEHYEQALAIAQELGDLDSMARSLGQIGLLLEEEGSLAAAVPALAQAFLIFRQLGSSDQQTASGSLARLREKMGEQAFAEAWQAMGGADMNAQPGTKDEGMTVKQAIEVVVANTVAVLTDGPERKQEWLGVLGEWQAVMSEQGLESPAVFLGVVRQLVDGIDPAQLTPQIPAEFQEVWDNLLRAIERKEI